jgi:hypothetical protein
MGDASRVTDMTIGPTESTRSRRKVGGMPPRAAPWPLPMRLASALSAIALSVSLSACVSVQVSTLHSFASADGRFTVTVPDGAMKQSTLAPPANGAFAGSTVTGFSTASASGARFAVLYADAVPGYLDAHGVDGTLLEAEGTNLSALNGTLVSAGPITVAGQPGREDRIGVGQAVYVFRTVFIGQRMYSISVTGSPAQVDSADAKVFLDSFASP